MFVCRGGRAWKWYRYLEWGGGACIAGGVGWGLGKQEGECNVRSMLRGVLVGMMWE